MADVTVRVDQVEQTSGGSFNVTFTVMVGAVPWQPNQQCSGTTEDEIKATSKAIAIRLVDVEKQRQRIKVGDTYNTGVNLTLP